MYTLLLDENNRILSVTFSKYNIEGVIVDFFPDGNIHDYKYIDEKYIYDPLPREERELLNPGEEIALLKQRISVLEKEAISKR